MRYLIEQSHAPTLLNRKGCRLRHRYAQQALVDCDVMADIVPADVMQRVDTTPIMVNGVAVTLADNVFDFGDYPHTLLKFVGPLDPIWLQQLKTHGVKLLFFCPPYGACVKLPSLFRSELLSAKFTFICAATPYRESHCSRGLPHERDKMLRAGLPENACDLVFFSREDRARVATELAARNVEILDSSSYKLRVRYSESLHALRDITGVKIADHSRATRLCSGEDLLTAVARPASTFGGSDLRGRGQIIAIADTGLDSGVNDASLHPDFQGRVKAIISWPLSNGWRDFASKPDNDDGAADRDSGHGTHVAGLALGNGARSAGLHQGIAPEAELVFQAIEQFVDVKSEYRARLKSGFYLSGRPLDLRDLFEQAREFGARIHVNAWGDEARGGYTDDCYEADHFLRQHPDALVLFAAGNSGADRDANRVLDTQSVYAPASAKNVVAIGATEGGLEDIGLHVNWGAFDATNSRFRAGVDRADAVSGQANHIALFSSTGPTKDGRIKPDVCAPGTNLAAPRSRLIQGKGWGLASPLPYYMYNGGTSTAVGVAGGAAAILREAWEHYNARPPSGQALKALLLLSAVPVLSRRDDAPEPIHVGGFGRIQIAQALPQNTSRKITLIDELDRGLVSGEIREHTISFGKTGALRAVLCWYDVPGDTLINNLDLCLIDSQGERIWGNHPAGEKGAPDTVNSVEAIDIKNLPCGRYLLRVIATNIPAGPQSYALAISQPLAIGPEIPLIFLRGIGPRLNERFHSAGVVTIDQLQSRIDILPRVAGLNSSARQQLVARLRVLAQVREVLAGNISDNEKVSVNQLLNGRKPSAMPDANWIILKEKCAPLVLVFNKRTLAKISLSMLFN